MKKNKLLDFLEMLDTNMAQQMLSDLQDDNKRTPQLYNAINKLLDRHKFHITKLMPEENTLNNINSILEQYNKNNDLDDIIDKDLILQ